MGETAAGSAWDGEPNVSKLKEAKISSNSDIVDGVAEVIAASMFSRHCEIASSREMTSFGCST